MNGELDVDVEAETDASCHRIEAKDSRAEGEERAVGGDERTKRGHKNPFIESVA